MIRSNDSIRTMENVRGGEGVLEFHDWLADDEKCANLRLLATIHIPVGGSLGNHVHTGEAEIYRVVQGTGEYNDNGTIVTIKSGDTVVCYDGEEHGVKNIGDDEFVFIAVIVLS